LDESRARSQGLASNAAPKEGPDMPKLAVIGTVEVVPEWRDEFPAGASAPREEDRNFSHWHFSDMLAAPINLRYWGQTGRGETMP
jgi:hypothetical protein